MSSRAGTRSSDLGLYSGSSAARSYASFTQRWELQRSMVQLHAPPRDATHRRMTQSFTAGPSSRPPARREVFVHRVLGSARERLAPEPSAGPAVDVHCRCALSADRLQHGEVALTVPVALDRSFCLSTTQSRPSAAPEHDARLCGSVRPVGRAV